MAYAWNNSPPASSWASEDGDFTPRSAITARSSGAGSASTADTTLQGAGEAPTGQSMAQRARNGAPAKAKAPAAAWRAIWCCERSYKKEEVPLLNSIMHAVTSLGGALINYKKAKTFEARVPRLPTQPYALITDGREARPCVRALEDMSDEHQPAIMIVLTEEAKHAARVASWARSMKAEGMRVPITIIRDPSELARLLVGSRLQTGPAVKQNGAKRDGAAQPSSAMADAESGDAHQQFAATPLPPRCECAPMAQAVVPTGLPMTGMCGATAAAPVPFVNQKLVDGVVPQVLRILAGALHPNVDAASVEYLLTASLPEVYED